MPTKPKRKKTVTVVTKVKLGDYDFQCENVECKKIHHKSAYCIAQQAQRHTITFTCDCGHNMVVPE